MPNELQWEESVRMKFAEFEMPHVTSSQSINAGLEPSGKSLVCPLNRICIISDVKYGEDLLQWHMDHCTCSFVRDKKNLTNVNQAARRSMTPADQCRQRDDSPEENSLTESLFMRLSKTPHSPMDPTCHPSGMVSDENRMRSFDLYPHRRDQLDIAAWVEAGFYWKGLGDDMVCFHCDITVAAQRYDGSVGPVTLHALYNPDCHRFRSLFFAAKPPMVPPADMLDEPPTPAPAADLRARYDFVIAQDVIALLTNQDAKSRPLIKQRIEGLIKDHFQKRLTDYTRECELLADYQKHFPDYEPRRQTAISERENFNNLTSASTGTLPAAPASSSHIAEAHLMM